MKSEIEQATSHRCRVCGVELTDDNWAPSYPKIHLYICKECHNRQQCLWQKANPDKARVNRLKWRKANRDKMKVINIRCLRKRGVRPYNENKECTLFLGVHVAERVLSHVFKNVKRMPIGNPGYDFVCGRGYKIDVKSSCLNVDNKWQFDIDHNTIADYFLCLAFDNRENLNPLHLWLLPGSKLNHLTAATIRPTTIDKWDEYKLDVAEMVACCDTIKKLR